MSTALAPTLAQHAWNYGPWKQFQGPDGEQFLSQIGECPVCHCRAVQNRVDGNNLHVSWYSAANDWYFDEPPCCPGGVPRDQEAADKAFNSFLPVMAGYIEKHGQSQTTRAMFGVLVKLGRKTSMYEKYRRNPWVILRVGSRLILLRIVLRIKKKIKHLFND